MVGCVNASSNGLDAFLTEEDKGKDDDEELRTLIENSEAFVFVKLDCLVSAVGLGCRLECYDSKNDFAPVDYDIFGEDAPPDALYRS